MSERKLSADEWLAEPEYEGLIVLDPDGWNRMDFEKSWAEKITQNEFNSRVMRSTCQIPWNIMDRWNAEANSGD